LIERNAICFFRFVSRRYENASLVITSNKAFTEWTELFEDPVLVTALLDRLLHHSVMHHDQRAELPAEGEAHPDVLKPAQKT